MLLVDVRTGESTSLARAKRENCLGCSGQLEAVQNDLEVHTLLPGVELIDIRELEEQPEIHVPHRRVPLSVLSKTDIQGPTILCCSKGIRSLRATIQLRSEGIARVFSLAGGIDDHTLELLNAADQ